jgi:hypothetical protein
MMDIPSIVHLQYPFFSKVRVRVRVRVGVWVRVRVRVGVRVWVKENCRSITKSSLDRIT